jgi:hypothetical protein
MYPDRKTSTSGSILILRGGIDMKSENCRRPFDCPFREDDIEVYLKSLTGIREWKKRGKNENEN